MVMLFHTFRAQEERRRFGGTDFMEMQYCKLPLDLLQKKRVSVQKIEHWKNDSLYISGDDVDAFFVYYGQIITNGLFGNGKIGPIDPFGINFYAREQVDPMMKRIKDERTPDYNILLGWFEAGEAYGGFYLLGI